MPYKKMKLIKSKKAMILYYPIIIGFVIGLAVFYVASLKSQPEGQTNFVGEIALNHLKTAKLAENTLFYIQDSGKQAAYQSIYDNALNGGFYSESECGSYEGYNLWTSETKDCYPDVKNNLALFMKDNLNEYMLINENTEKFIDNYDFLLKKDNEKLRVIGIATLPIRVPIILEEKVKKKVIKKEIGNYSLNPSFEHIIDYDLNDYNTIKEKTSEIASICEKEADVKKCVEEKVVAINTLNELNKNPLRWSIDGFKGSEKIFKFSVKNRDRKLLVYDKITQKTEFKNIEVRFALHIKDLPPPPIEGLIVQNKQKAEGTVTVRWKKSEAADVDYYMIYYSKNKFLNEKIENHQIKDTTDQSKKINSKKADTNTNYIEETEEYIYILGGLEDNKDYYFAVTAVDKAGNEINNKDSEQKLESNKNYISAQSEDNLAPNKINKLDLIEIAGDMYKFRFELPSKNEDGTELKEDKLWLYLYTVQSDNCGFGAIKGGLNQLTSKYFEFPFTQSTIDVQTSSLTAGKYCFAFILRDDTGNPILDDANINNLVVIYGPELIS